MRLGVGAPPLPATVMTAMSEMHDAIERSSDARGEAPHPPPRTPARQRQSPLTKDVTYGLGRAFHALAYQLYPRWTIVDRGGGGRCGNNSLAFAAGVAGIVQCSGAELRRAVCNHAQELLMADYEWAP